MAQKKLQQNKSPVSSSIVSTLKPLVLCADLVFCDHCGRKMNLTSNVRKYLSRDGSEKKTKKIKYICHSKSLHQNCDGQTSYSAPKLDDEIIKAVMIAIQKNNLGREQELALEKFQSIVQHMNDYILNTQYELNQEEEKLNDLQNEVVNVIRGTSAFSSMLLTQLMNKSEHHVFNLKEKLKQQNIELQDHDQFVREFDKKYNDLTEAILSFEELSFEEKQKILHYYIKKIYVDKNYKIKIEWAFLSET